MLDTLELIRGGNYPATWRLLTTIVTRWPEHEEFVAKSFATRDQHVLDVSELLSSCILKLSDDAQGLDLFCDDYRFLCENIVLPEEIYFRRHGAYRLTTFVEAKAECYDNDAFMSRYMGGLLLSDVIWSNHASAFASFASEYIERLPSGARHLEIGPGHGLFLYFAALSARIGSIVAWDVSPTSIEKTKHALLVLGSPKTPLLRLRNLFDENSDPSTFDSIVMSEILEHLEDPVSALRVAARQLAPGGLIFINVPANSPAPDHIFLFQSLAHAEEIVEQAGLKIISSKAYPMSGATLERARKHRLSISCVITASL